MKTGGRRQSRNVHMITNGFGVADQEPNKAPDYSKTNMAKDIGADSFARAAQKEKMARRERAAPLKAKKAEDAFFRNLNRGTAAKTGPRLRKGKD